MRMLAMMAVSTAGFLGYMNSPWTMISKTELADLRTKAAAIQQPASEPPAPASNGAWMWQDRANPLDSAAYDGAHPLNNSAYNQRVSTASGGWTTSTGPVYYSNTTIIRQAPQSSIRTPYGYASVRYAQPAKPTPTPRRDDPQ